MTDQSQCDLCATNSITRDLRKLCCTARHIASLPTYEQMLNTGRKLCRQYGHDPKALSDRVQAARKARAEAAMAETANR